MNGDYGSGGGGGRLGIEHGIERSGITTDEIQRYDLVSNDADLEIVQEDIDAAKEREASGRREIGGKQRNPVRY